jgi:hypothetical protein
MSALPPLRRLRNAAAHVRRTDGFPHCPDVLANAACSHETEEVAAFEELVGSHDGYRDETELTVGGGEGSPPASR